LTQHHFIEMAETGSVMNAAIDDSIETIDYRTSRSICDAVGERLQQSLRPEDARLSPRLQQLMEELRRRDSEDFRKPSN
jgi:hypothetical protein